MDVTALLVNYLNKRYGMDAINVLAENALYYILGDKFFTFDRNDMMTKQKRKIIMMMNQNTLLEISDMFHDNNINYIGFKGVILSNLLYNNSTSRNAGDIDVLVEKANFECAYHLLMERGYELQDINDYDNPHHIVLKDRTAIIELHRNIIHPDINIDETYLRNSRSTIQILGKSVDTFTLTGTLLHLFYHLYMDVCLEDTIMYDFFARKQYPKVKRFLYRAYEIAMFSEKYRDKICWDKIGDDLQRQKLRVCFKKMIMDIIEIFPDLFPDSLLKIINQLNYVEDYRDRLYEYLTKIEIYQHDNMEGIIQNYIEVNWQKRKERNICKNVGDSILLDKQVSTNEREKLSCFIDIQKRKKGIELSFNVLNDSLCITETDDYDTLTSDGIHLLLCGTKEYSYYSLFFFPKKIENTIKVIVYDVLNNRSINPTEQLICADFRLTEEGYTITAILSDKFIEQNCFRPYFYMGLIISDCSNESHSRKAELVLSEENSLWYDPTYFAKIMVDN